MAGSSMTFTLDRGQWADGHYGRYRKLLCDWVSDDSAGTASGTYGGAVGELVKVVTDPGSAAPTDNYDIDVTENGVSVLAGIQQATALGTRDTANTEETYLYILNGDGTPIGIAAFPIVCGPITVSVANAGNSKTGRIILYFRE